jgi:hypothetical protein
MEVRKQFTDDELVKLTLAIAAINGWKRFGIAFRTPPGHYQPAIESQVFKCRGTNCQSAQKAGLAACSTCDIYYLIINNNAEAISI